MTRGVVIVAGGVSSRFGADKLNTQLFDKKVIEQTVNVFRSIADKIVVVGKQVESTIFAKGGDTRSQSVLNGLVALGSCDVVAIHDGARPFLSRQLATTLFEQAILRGSAVPRLPITDTVWQQTDKLSKVDRNTLFAVQTPQAFDYQMILSAYESSTRDYTDESALFFDTYGKINFVDGQRSNAKLTYKDDLPKFRVGVGYDVHAFTDGDGVILGGVKLPYSKKLLGHSDADVLCHAICDAVLSASNNKDIGWQFPDTDEQYKGADSIKLLKKCVSLAQQSGYQVVNVSAVVICQAPKIAPFIDQMSAKLANALGVDVSCVNLSATTTERLGTLGNGDGVAVSATALLQGVR